MTALATRQISTAARIQGTQLPRLRPVTPTASTTSVAAELEQIGSTVRYHRDKTIVEEGDRLIHVFKVTEGALRAIRLLPDGRRCVTRFLLPGDFFGFSDDTEAPHTIEAVSDVTLVRYTRPAFEALLERHPQACRHFLNLMCHELSAAQERLLLLGRKSALERLSSFLLTMAPKGSAALMLPMNRSDVADYLGLTVETVSRFLTQLRNRRVIDLRTANEIVLCDREALRSISENEIAASHATRH